MNEWLMDHRMNRQALYLAGRQGKGLSIQLSAPFRWEPSPEPPAAQPKTHRPRTGTLTPALSPAHDLPR